MHNSVKWKHFKIIQILYNLLLSTRENGQFDFCILNKPFLFFLITLKDFKEKK